METDEKVCPRCAETVKAAAVVCKHCGHNFQTGENPDVKVFPVPPKKGMSFGKGCLIACAVVIGLVVLGAIAGGGTDAAKEAAEKGFKEGAAEAAKTTQASEQKPAVKVTARQLEAAYASNEAAAQQQFGDQSLEVSATIRAIELGIGDEPYLVLAGDNPFSGPQAKFTAESRSKASSLSKGQKIILICQSVSEVMGVPMLADCDIQ